MKFLPILGSKKKDFIGMFLPFIVIFIFNIGLYLYNPSILFSSGNSIYGAYILVGVLLLFDVPHVWSTIYKTYTDKNALNLHKKLYILTPFLSFLGLFLITLYDTSLSLLFWLLAAFAAYHFIKQQVGFILLYGNKEGYTKKKRLLDSTIGYIATLVPMLYWFSNLETRNYNWFSNSEFIKISIPIFPYIWFLKIMFIIYYIYSEYKRYINGEVLNGFKYLYIIGTFLVWYYGIVWTNNMLIFGFGNMVLHGWNFFALVYYTTKKRIADGLYVPTNKIFAFITSHNILYFIIPLIFIGFIEQFGWSAFTGNDIDFFKLIVGNEIYKYTIVESKYLFAFFISLLSLPQTTHYILDGFIWKKGHI